MNAVRVVLTGGAGFVGSHIARQLVAGGHDVVVVDSLDPAAHRRPFEAPIDGVDYRWADVTDPAAWLAAALVFSSALRGARAMR